jgi:poly(A) polymerase
MLRVSQRPTLHADWIDPQAIDIVRNLQRAGFKSYLVGGCVRDLLVGIHPKDFDIATNAEPNQIRKKIYQAYVIGNRFRLVLAKRGEKQFEIATFRKEAKRTEEESEDQPIKSDNTFGSPEEDALRRDFTINGLFYDPINDELIDYCNGMADIKDRTIRMIGEPDVRITEDPIRSLRAIRLSHKLNFAIDFELRKSIAKNAAMLEPTILPRKREEYIKILRLKDPATVLLEMKDLDVLKYTLKTLDQILDNPESKEIFHEVMSSFDSLCVNKDSTVELYLPLIYAMFKIFNGDESSFEEFMKNELGMFRSEQGLVMSTIDLMNRLPKIESFLKRSSRRQDSFGKLTPLPMTLRLLEFERIMPVAELAFWKDLVARQPVFEKPVAGKSDRGGRRGSGSRGRRNRGGGEFRDRGSRNIESRSGGARGIESQGSRSKDSDSQSIIQQGSETRETKARDAGTRKDYHRNKNIEKNNARNDDDPN